MSRLGRVRGPIFWGKIVNRNFAIGGLAAACVMLSACATAPSKISAAYVSPMKFQNYDCNQIAAEQSSVEQRTTILYHTLKKRNTNDKVMMGVGLVVAWPALLFMKGNNSAQNAEFAQLKGDYEALRGVSVSKQCNLNFAPDLAASAANAKKAPKANAVAPAAPTADAAPLAAPAPGVQ